MIRANELRINNRYFLNGKEFTLDMKMMYAFCSGSFQYDLADVEGIPLTIKVLEEISFDIEVEYEFITGSRIKYVPGEGYRPHTDNWGYAPLAYLHQLQTLYFALTGNELI